MYLCFPSLLVLLTTTASDVDCIIIASNISNNFIYVYIEITSRRKSIEKGTFSDYTLYTISLSYWWQLYIIISLFIIYYIGNNMKVVIYLYIVQWDYFYILEMLTFSLDIIYYVTFRSNCGLVIKNICIYSMANIADLK